MRSLRLLLLIAIGAALPSLNAQDVEPAPQQEAAPTVLHYVTREFYLPDPIAGPHGLDALEVHAGLPGKHPLALLTHGTASTAQEHAEVTPWRLLPQALWFARHGYVALVIVRRGYGRSEGEIDGRQGGCNGRGSFTAAAEAGVDDLRAAARYGATLPEVDPATIVSTGVSTGGLVQVALSANPMPGLKAAISFAGGRGGDGKGHNCNLDGLVSTFHGFGKHSSIPTLWIYAENDKWFPPEMAHRFDEAFRKGGATEEFVMVPPDGEDGHHFFSHVAKWSPIVEEFLRKQDLLPLHDVVLPPPALPDVPPPAGLPEAGMGAFHNFLRNGPYKAFATNSSGAWGYSTAAITQQIADSQALDRCKQMAKGVGGCQIVQRGSQ